MVESAVKVVGRIGLAPGRSWDEVIASEPERARLLVDFLALAAPALGLRASALQVHHCIWIAGVRYGDERRRGWHRDAAKKGGHVLCVVGDAPTEFLLGAYPESWLEPGSDLGALGLVAGLRSWAPEPGEVVHYDRYAIHRRPEGIARYRAFLLASPA